MTAKTCRRPHPRDEQCSTCAKHPTRATDKAKFSPAIEEGGCCLDWLEVSSVSHTTEEKTNAQN